MGNLIIIRHGQSLWNLENRFTGWIDIPLSKKGEEEAINAGKILSDFKFDISFTSTLQRAEDTLKFILKENKFINNKYRRVHDISISSWYDNNKDLENESNIFKVVISQNLNERYYGDLQGLNKKKTMEEFGEEQVHIWRRSYDIAPPNGESLKMTYERTIPYFKKYIEPLLKEGKDVLIVAHGNSLRSIIKYIENLSNEEILDVEIGTGVPILYNLDDEMNILDKKELN